MKTILEMDRLQGKMQQSRMKMSEQLHKIMNAKSPMEREQFQQEHRDMMQLHMQARKDSGLMC